MPCSLGTKAILKLSPPLPEPPPSSLAEPPLPSPHAVRTSSAARPREAISFVVGVFLIGHLIGVGVSFPAVPPARRAGASQVVRWGAAPAGGRRPELCAAARLRP